MGYAGAFSHVKGSVGSKTIINFWIRSVYAAGKRAGTCLRVFKKKKVHLVVSTLLSTSVLVSRYDQYRYSNLGYRHRIHRAIWPV